MLRTVKFLSTFSCVSLRDMKETGAASRPVPPNHSDIRRAQVLQPPDSSSDILRGSSLIAEQSPASSHRPLTGTLVSYINTPVCVKVFFKKVSLFLPKFRGRFWCSLPGGLAGGPRAAPTGLRDRFCKNRRGGCPHPARGSPSPAPHLERNPSVAFHKGAFGRPHAFPFRGDQKVGGHGKAVTGEGNGPVCP